MKKNYLFNSFVTLMITCFCLFSNQLSAQSWTWANGYGSTDGVDEVSKTCIDGTGNIYVIGTFSGTTINIGSFTLNNHTGISSASVDFYIAKFGSSGNVIWAKSFGTDITEWGNDIACDNSGNIYICGSYGGNSLNFGNGISVTSTGNSLNYFVAKLNTDGVAQWARTAKPETSCEGYCVAVANDGDVYAVGGMGALSTVFNNPLDSLYYSNSRSDNNFMVIFDNNGNFKSYHRVEGDIIGTSGNGGINDIVITSEKIVYAIGEMANPFDTSWTKDIFVAKYSGNGGIIWRRNFGSDYNKSEYGNSIATDANSNIYITGSFRTSSIDFGSYTLSAVKENEYNRYAAKLDNNGNVLWAKRLNNSVPAVGNSIITDVNGNVYVGGYGIDTVLFSVPVAYWDASIQKLSSSGAVQWTMKAGNGFMGGTAETATSISIDANGNLIVAGTFFGPNTYFGNIQVNEKGLGDWFLAKLATNGSNGVFKLLGNNIENIIAYPNPANNYLYIKSTGISDYFIIDVNGKMCMQGTVSDNESINIENLSNGIYTIRMTDDKKMTQTTRIVKQ